MPAVTSILSAPPREPTAHEPQALSLVELLALRPTSLALSLMPLGRQMKRFAEQMETLGQAMVKAGREHSLRISLSSTGTPSFTPLDKDITADLEGHDRLWAFLRKVGVRAIELEPRLESNQIVDLFQVLFASRRHLQRSAAGHPTHGLAAALQSPDGLAFACTVTRLNEGVLTVSYSYCRTRLSRLVT